VNAASNQPHVSVLLDEVIENLACGPGDIVIDGTFGAGGYSRAILATGAKVVAFDRDPTVRRFAAGFPEDRFRLVEARFSESAVAESRKARQADLQERLVQFRHASVKQFKT